MSGTVVAVPQVLHLAEDSGIHLVQRLELVEDDDEMTVQRLLHNDFKQVAEVADCTIDMDPQLFLQCLLKFLAEHSLAVLGYEEISIVKTLQRSRD